MEFEELIRLVMKGVFSILITILNFLIYITVIIGSIASLILLIKLFPETAILITKPLYSILIFIFQIIKALVYSILTLILIYLIYQCYNLVEILRKKREINREKFLNELAKKLNKFKGKNNGR